LTYKDEYEVARLLLTSQDQAKAEFDGDLKLTYHLAPPIFSGKGADGRSKKRAFGAWMTTPLRLLAGLKSLRATPLDIFGYSAERKLERALIRQYQKDMKTVLAKVTPKTPDINDAIKALAALPLDIRGFGPVKLANEAKAAKRREELLSVINSGGGGLKQAAE
jgi:indolepyruvate ferredoxin oxidoreductase